MSLNAANNNQKTEPHYSKESDRADMTEFEKKFLKVVDDVAAGLMAQNIVQSTGQAGGTMAPTGPMLQIASLIKKQCREFKKQAAAGQSPIYLPKHGLLVTFEAWSNQSPAILPASTCSNKHEDMMALFVQSFLDYASEAQKKIGDNDPRGRLHYGYAVQILTALQDKMEFPKGADAKKFAKPIMFPPLKVARPQ